MYPSDRYSYGCNETWGQNYVEIADLVDKAGDHIARILDSEAAVVVNSASSGIALSIAAIVTEGNRRKVKDSIKRSSRKMK